MEGEYGPSRMRGECEVEFIWVFLELGLAAVVGCILGYIFGDGEILMERA